MVAEKTEMVPETDIEITIVTEIETEEEKKVQENVPITELLFQIFLQQEAGKI